MYKIKLSPYHKIFYNEWKIAPDSNSYNIVFDQTISGNLDVLKLEDALTRFISDYVLLNSHVTVIDEELYWTKNININKLTCFSTSDINEIYNYVSCPFNLENEPLYRFAVFNDTDNNYRLILVFHHILIDGASFNEVVTEINKYYNNNKYKLKLSVDEQSRSITSINRKFCKPLNQHAEQSDEFWKSRLSGVDPVDLRFIKKSNCINEVHNKIVKEVSFSFIDEILAKLEELQNKYGLSAYWYGQIIFAILLYHYTSQEKLSISYPVAIKEYSGLIYGVGVNSNVFLYEIHQLSRVSDLIAQVNTFTKKITRGAVHYGYYPVNQIVENINKDILDVMFAQTKLKDFEFNFDNVTVVKVNHEFNIDLPCKLLFEQEFNFQRLNYRVRYNRSEIDETILNQFIKHYQKLFIEILDDLNRGISDKLVTEYSVLYPDEYQRIIYDWNKTAKEFPQDKTIHQLFEEQVAKTPDNIAVIYENIKLTYRELNEKANQLGHYLRESYQIKGDDLVALCLNRSEYLLIAILGILKAGGAYVPINPDFPKEQINSILKDIQTKVLIIDSKHNYCICRHGKGESLYRHILIIDEKFVQTLKKYPLFNPQPNITNKSCVYVMYTSGTTNIPKGILVEHDAAVTRILYMVKAGNMSFRDVVLFKTNYVFDVSFSDLFTTLVCGASLIITKDTFNVHEIYTKLRDNGITTCHFTPSQFLVFKDFMQNSFNTLPSLKKILFSGEAFYYKYFDNITADVMFLNYYGPTETGEVILYKFRHLEYFSQFASLIGYKFVSTLLYVLNSDLTPLPIGAVGELYIGGAGLARGYLNLPELTRERFIPNPFQTEEEKQQSKNSRIYKTGDLVRYLPDGNLEYIGRNDSQIKIRGYRVELEEIENVLLAYSGIKYCVVINREFLDKNKDTLNPNTYLAAYYVSDHVLDEAEILAYISEKLPHYMIPNVFIRIKNLPLTVNGKLDKNALPSPEYTAKSDYVAPRNELERKVCGIYAEALELPVDRVGLADDFFKLGGNSILAIKLVNKLATDLNMNVTVAIFIKYRAIAAMLEHIASNSIEEVVIPKADNLSNKICYPLSFAQERLWFIDRYENGSNAYNIPLMLEINSRVDLTLLKQAIDSIINRHEILSSLIKTDEFGNSYQEICSLKEKPLIFNEQIVSNKCQLNKLINKSINHIYRLNEEYPITLSIFSKTMTKSNKHYLCIVVHHIAFDGWSIDIFIGELQKYYNYFHKLKSGERALLDLPELTIQYKDYALWQKSHINDKLIKEQLEYWVKKLDNYQTLNLPLDSYRPQFISYVGDDISFTLSEITSNKLRELAKKLNVSLYSLLLSGYYILLSSYSNQDDIVIGVPVANRHYKQLEHLIGFFVNSLALRNQVSKDNLLIDYIKGVSTELMVAQSNQDLPFEKLVANLNISQDTSRHPIFQVMFAMQNFENSILKDNPLFRLYRDYEYKIAKFDLTVFIDDSQNELKGTFNYATSLFGSETILQMIKTFEYILEQVAQLDISSKIKVKELSYLNKEDYQKVIYHRNKTEKEYPGNKTIQQLFENQVLKTPNDIAIIYADIKLTYKELNEKANQLGHYLRETYKIHGDDLIALYLDRNEYLLIGILGVLKSGAGYVPIDHGYLVDRVDYILKDTKARVLITTNHYEKKFCNKSDMTTLLVDHKQFVKTLEKYPKLNPEISIDSGNLAYVIYTSGTTGNPKGVMVEHQGGVNYLYNVKDKIFNSCGIVDFSTNIAVDLTVTNTLGALCSGYTISIYDGDIRNLEDYINHLLINKINMIKVTPSYFTLLLRVLSKTQINTIVLGGEKVSKNIFDEIDKPDLVIYDEYGPTETVVGSCLACIYEDKLVEGSLNIGVPYNNYKVYILDNDKNPVPPGAIGELYIGGIGLARGYLNQPQLTKDVFISNKFQLATEKIQNKNERLYKTGDLVRYLADGKLEYIGRNDSQVKINGIRIELAEIENLLNSYPGVKQSVVIEKEYTKGNLVNKYLVAYYVTDKVLDKNIIMTYLEKVLPGYLVPNVILQIDGLPLLPSGKLDKNQLPGQELSAADTYSFPRNVTELKICTIYSEILHVPVNQIGIDHDFFKLGGNSLLAINLLYRLQQKIKINLNDIFRLRTPAKMAQLPVANNSLYNKLKHVKDVYRQLSSYAITLKMQRKKSEYLQKVRHINFINQLKDISNVLLTGATGHLGCHILYQLLHETEYKIFLLIRAQTDSKAYERINRKYRYYFNISLDKYLGRIIVMAADIEEPYLKLDKNQYHELMNKIDSIIHPAALVKHYGNYATFYSANVQATLNLLELAKQTKLKDFHYISTLSILTNCHVANSHYQIWVEDDELTGLGNNIDNIYNKTKYEGELATIKYREYGINSNIYRVGNLAMSSKNYRNQENIEENAFFTRIRTILNVGVISKEISEVEISPVDCTALAITKLFNQKWSNNKTYHVANSYICNLFEILKQCSNVNVRLVTFGEFIDILLTRLNNKVNRQQIERFMLHQMWLEDINLENLTQTAILQNRTDAILKKLNFSWPQITTEMIAGMISQKFIGDEKMKKKEPIFEYLESIAELIPTPFYWSDLEGRTMGLNILSLKGTGALKKADIVGKTPYEIYKNKDIADKLYEDIKRVIKTGKSSQTEDVTTDIITGKLKYYSATRAPLRNKKNEVIGVVGTSIDITAQKEAERLKLENEKQKLENEKQKAAAAAAAEEQEKFRKIVGQMVHDIQSPLASLRGIVEDTAGIIPEGKRTTMRQASMRISDITSHMLLSYKNETSSDELAEPVLVSMALSEVVSEKRFEHKGITIDTDFAMHSYFAFTRIEPGQFKRMVSNVINNAVQALGNKSDAKIKVELNVILDWVTIFIEDNGCGMSKELVSKIKNDICVTSGKKDGHGIGLTQVRDTLKRNFGLFNINSTEGESTMVTLKLPTILPPDWITEEIKIIKGDTIVVLDDDDSIHGTWDSKLEPVLTKLSQRLTVKHFRKGSAAIEYINSLSATQKDKICLLSDYELFNQKLNGLQVIEQTKIKRSTLVTSHYNNREIRELAVDLGVKILPKELVFAVGINLDKKLKPGSKKVDMVCVDDDLGFVHGYVERFFSHLKIDMYRDPNNFLEDVEQYPLNTKIVLDNFYSTNLGRKAKYLGNGIEIAEKLNKKGFTNLVMLTGEEPNPAIIPPYLTVILKDDDEKIKNMAN